MSNQRKGRITSKAELIEWLGSWYDYDLLEDFEVIEKSKYQEGFAGKFYIVLIRPKPTAPKK